MLKAHRDHGLRAYRARLVQRKLLRCLRARQACGGGFELGAGLGSLLQAEVAIRHLLRLLQQPFLQRLQRSGLRLFIEATLRN